MYPFVSLSACLLASKRSLFFSNRVCLSLSSTFVEFACGRGQTISFKKMLVVSGGSGGM